MSIELPPSDPSLEGLFAGTVIAQLTECLYEAWGEAGRDRADALDERIALAEAAAIARLKNAPFDGLAEATQMQIVDLALPVLRAIFVEIRLRHRTSQ